MQRKSGPGSEPNQFSNRLSASSATSGVQLNRVIEELLTGYEAVLSGRNIELEIDLDRVKTSVNSELVTSIARSLFDNAIEWMPTGGELSVTLIDGNHQWELEVADTSDRLAKSEPEIELTNDELPTVLTFPATDSLRQAYRLALGHGGEIQTWNCPLGGVAHVWVSPKMTWERQTRRSIRFA